MGDDWKKRILPGELADAIISSPISALFDVVPLTLPYFLLIGLVICGYIVVVEVVKV